MISDVRPKGFKPIFQVVSCFIEQNGEILLLKRQNYKPQPNTFGLPAGKVEKGETIEQAMLREVKEETGIELKEKQYKFFKTKYVRQGKVDFLFYSYYCKLDKRPEVIINPKEHQCYMWVEPKKAMELELIQDGDNCLKEFYKL